MSSYLLRRTFTLCGCLLLTSLTWADDTTIAPFIAQPQIANGSNAISGQVPWQVALIKLNLDEQKFGDFCSGTLINKQWVVTAAHCFDEEDELADKPELKLGVIVGATDLQGENEPQQYFFIKRRIIHPTYNKKAGMDGDIALIELDAPVDLAACGRACKVVPWADAKADRQWNVARQRVQIAGWGQTESADYSLVLQVAPLQIQHCTQTAYRMNNKTWDLTDKMICAGAVSSVKPEDTCVGDSGGGLIVNAMGSQPVLLGITSFGEVAKCGDARVPAIYTKVSSYDDWILSYVDPAAYAKRQKEQAPAPSSGGGGGGSLSVLGLLGLISLAALRRRWFKA